MFAESHLFALPYAAAELRFQPGEDKHPRHRMKQMLVCDEWMAMLKHGLPTHTTHKLADQTQTPALCHH